MPTELECKLAVADHAPIRTALRDAGAAPVGRVVEINHLFDRPAGDLRRADCGLRVRTAEAVDRDETRATLTYKGPRCDGAFKQREEIEVVIDDAAAAIRILESLGYAEQLRFEKRRETWRLSDCTIELDEIPPSQRFIEVEGPDESAIRGVLDKLGLDPAASIRDSYVAMILAGREDDPRPIIARFGND